MSDVRLSNSRSTMSLALCVAFGIGVAIGVGQHRLEDAVADREVAVAGLEQSLRAASELGDFLVGQPRLAFELFRPLERRGGVTEPDALQIGLAVRCARRRPAGLRRGREREGEKRDRAEKETRRARHGDSLRRAP